MAFNSIAVHDGFKLNYWGVLEMESWLYILIERYFEKITFKKT